MIQWCIAALPLLLLGAFAIEISHWHTTRARLSLSVQRAVDQASLSGGTAESLKTYLQKQMPPDLKLSVRACITDPVDALMADFMDRRLSQKLGMPVIRHDHIAQQHKGLMALGRPGGRGARSGKTIFEANTLTVEVTAQGHALSPWVRQVYDPIRFKLTHRAIMQSHRQRSQPCFTLP